MIELRRHPRQQLTKASIDLASSHYASTNCNVIDVSSGGLLSSNISSRVISQDMIAHNKKINAVISLGNVHLRLSVIPKWIQNIGSPYLTVGFEVSDNIDKWFDFIRTSTNLYVKLQDDVWGLNGVKHLRMQ